MDPRVRRSLGKGLGLLFLSIGFTWEAYGGGAGPAKPAPTTFDLTVGSSVNNGNTDSESVDLSTALNGAFLRSGDYRIGAEGHLTRGDRKDGEGEETSVKNGKVEGKVSSPRLSNGGYLYSESSIFSDDIANVDFRAIESIGCGFDLMQRERTKLSVEGGCSPMWEKINGETDYFTLFRFAQIFTHVFANGASVKQKIEYLPSSDYKDKYLLNGSVELESPLNEWVHLALTLKNTFNSEPGEDNEKNDTSLIAGIRVKL